MSDLINLNDFKSNLRDKVKTEFINLIPEEALSEFISDTVTSFEREELKEFVLDELRVHVKLELKKMFADNSYGSWNNDRNMYEISPELEKILVSAAPSMFASVMHEVSRNVFMNMKNSF